MDAVSMEWRLNMSWITFCIEIRGDLVYSTFPYNVHQGIGEVVFGILFQRFEVGLLWEYESYRQRLPVFSIKDFLRLLLVSC